MDRAYTKTIPLGKANVATMRTMSGQGQYIMFATKCNDVLKEARTFDAYWIPPDPEDDMTTVNTTIQSEGGQNNAPTGTPPTKIDWVLDEHPTDYDDDVRLGADVTPTQELLVWHYRLAHLPFKRLQLMARLGLMPTKLATCRVPECPACRYAKVTKIPWRTKGTQVRTKTINQPGQCVSVDQMESSDPGLIAQLKGTPTKSRYKYATVFVDQFSDLSFIFLQKTLSSEETVKAKLAFEAYAKLHGVHIRHYHADNGRFADNLFIRDVEQKGQSITYCGVNEHFQIGGAEKKIWDLQDLARMQLNHAKHGWRQAIDTSLWPYALRNACQVHNHTPRTGTDKTPLELFVNAPKNTRL